MYNICNLKGNFDAYKLLKAQKILNLRPKYIRKLQKSVQEESILGNIDIRMMI